MLTILWSLVLGAGLGYVFFWGLWQTIQHVTGADHPYLWIFLSFLIRTAIVLLGFYVLLLIQWQLIAVALLGFILVRLLVTRYTVKKPTSMNSNT